MALVNRKSVFLILGPLTFLVLVLLDKPASLSIEAYYVLAATCWIAIWWVTEAIPIWVTALLPIVLFPLTGALDLASTTASFGHKYIFLYIGGFLIAIAIERWNLHKRIALNIIHLIGSSVPHIILGFMIATAFLSMWISNTATSVMMLPIGAAVISQFNASNKNDTQLGKALMLCIAYSASIGGFATLIGTPPNLVLAGILEELYSVKLSFSQWIVYGLPISMLLLFICWRYMTRVAYKFESAQFPGGRAAIKKMLDGLGRMGYEEKSVLTVFVITGICWMSRSLLQKIIPPLDDTIIAMASGIALFILPAKSAKRRILNWEEAVKLPWGIILLFGGGMALAKAFTVTGLAEWIALQMTTLNGLSLIIIMLVLVAAVNFITEITSNLATTAMLLPVLAPMALALDVHPFMLMVPVTVAASCAFMLPVATPPNAVVFGSGYLRVPDMIRAGFFLNILSIILITLITYFVLPYLWDIEPTQFPDIFRQVISPESR